MNSTKKPAWILPMADFSRFINIGTEYRIDRNAFFRGQKIYWNELLPYLGLSVPLNLSRGRWITSLEGGS